MVAAYREYTLGRGVYLADISSMRDHVGAGRPRQRSSLIFPTWGAPDGRRPGDRLPKGRARVARTARTDRRHGLLERIRGYTLANFGKVVTTADLRNAMEQASATDLSEFFARWVYLR